MVTTKSHPVWIIGVIILLVMFRLVPHPPNATPIAAMALFAGAMFANRKLAFAVPLLAMFISDALIGFHSTVLYVYAGIVLTILIGRMIHTISFIRVFSAALTSSVIFFALTNFGAWLHHEMYSQNLSGLMQAYAAGLPFFRNSVLANLLFVFILFYGMKIVEYRTTKIEGANSLPTQR